MRDIYPNLYKKDTLPQRIFDILKISYTDKDFSAGSTFTKQGLSKILAQIEVLQQKHPELFEELRSFEEPQD